MTNKKALLKQESFFRTRGRDRTGTSVTSLVFETSASTNSATRAYAAARIHFQVNSRISYLLRLPPAYRQAGFRHSGLARFENGTAKLKIFCKSTGNKMASGR